jgi:ABC-2 type transport system permease protein
MQADAFAIAVERQTSGPVAFLRACGAAGWLEFRNLRYYPTNLVMAAAGELTTVGLWYFIGTFLSTGANSTVQKYGGSYLAFVLVGVLLNQVGMAALKGPFETVSEAFWDKRLETYRLSIHGIWANIVGRLGWLVLFSTVLQLGALAILLAIGALTIHATASTPLALLVYLLFVLANAGIGIAGASLFFLLEVKTGQDPITWAYRYLVMLASGLYVPLSVLPVPLRGVSAVLPQTYAFSAERSILLTGAGWGGVGGSVTGLTIATAVTVAAGYGMLRAALIRAEGKGGIGVVV